jgi:UPF0271 protein
MSADAEVMPHIDQASIACGFHAGDPLTMLKTLALAKQLGVAIGAHPAYPDLAGFGRRSLTCSALEIRALLLYQIAALDGMAQSMGASVSYIKPHGALYNDMMADETLRLNIMQTVASYHRPLPLVVQATTEAHLHRTEAAQAGITLYFEVFADRAYADNGQLLPRNQPGAILNREQMLKQVQDLHRHRSITTVGGRQLVLEADTLCLHGDNPIAVGAIQAVRQLLHS